NDLFSQDELNSRKHFLGAAGLFEAANPLLVVDHGALCVKKRADDGNIVAVSEKEEPDAFIAIKFDVGKESASPGGVIQVFGISGDVVDPITKVGIKLANGDQAGLNICAKAFEEIQESVIRITNAGLFGEKIGFEAGSSRENAGDGVRCRGSLGVR